MRRNNLAKNLERIKIADESKAEADKLEAAAIAKKKRDAAIIALAVTVAVLEVVNKPRRRTVGEFLTGWI